MTWLVGLPLGIVIVALGVGACSSEAPGPAVGGTPTPIASPAVAPSPSVVELPAPRTEGDVSLEEALASRRSVREFTPEPLTLEQISQLLWAAQGITADWGGRTAPSAGALYPLEVYVVTAEGISHYLPEGHRLATTPGEDLRGTLAAAALGQSQVADAPAVFVIAAVVARSAEKYGDRAERYVQLEAGHACQNLLLEAVALGLGAVPTGAFSDEGVRSALGLPQDEAPLYLVPVGYPSDEG
jgi:SagB-type dehydrogenase family enzyme